jgi:hypothetical protein
MTDTIRTTRPLSFLFLLAAFAVTPGHAADSLTTVQQIQADAKALRPLARAALGRRFLDATAALPSITPRTVVTDSGRTRYLNANEAAALPDTARARMITRTLGEQFYYTTRYGSPLAYLRPLEILAAAGMTDVAGRRIVDFGYGTIGHLRLLASLGADAVGVEVDPLLRALYSDPGDQGAVRGARGQEGRITLVHGQFPADETVNRAVGEGYDLFISKNTLKNGYIHPEQKVDPRMLVHLGVDDTSYVRAIHRILKLGGRALIYNLSPAPSAPGQPYKPWADGRSPFPAALWEAEGFRVIAFDRDDSKEARTMAHALGWDRGPSPMDLEKDLFALYTLVEKRAR